MAEEPYECDGDELMTSCELEDVGSEPDQSGGARGPKRTTTSGIATPC